MRASLTQWLAAALGAVTLAVGNAAAAAEPDGLGCTQVTEILYTPGVTLVGELPEGCALDTVYTIAVAAGAAQPELAGKLVEALASPGLSEFKRANGIKA